MRGRCRWDQIWQNNGVEVVVVDFLQSFAKRLRRRG
jgi:hypothetical protein